MQDRLLERPLNETSLTTAKVIFFYNKNILFVIYFSQFQFQHDMVMF